MIAARLSLVAVMVVSCARAGSWSTPDGEDAVATSPQDAAPDAAPPVEPCGGAAMLLRQVGNPRAVLIAADRGQVHLVVSPAPGGSLLYLHREPGGAWTDEVIGSTPASVSSLVVDDVGAAHVAVLTGDGRTVRVGRRAPEGAWVWGTAATTSERLYGLDLALGPDGRRHVVYGHATAFGERSVWLARDEGSSWTAERVPAPTNAFGLFSLAIDAEARPHVVYGLVGGSQSWLGYGRKGLDAWQFTTLTDPYAYFDVGALAIDGAGRPNVVYARTSGSIDTFHARLTDTGWQSARIAFDSVSPSLVFGPAGPRILALSRYHRRWIVAAPAARDTYDVGDVYPGTIATKGDLAVDAAGSIHAATVDDDGMLVYSRPCDPQVMAAAWRY